ncbi:hypothetical protein RZS08_37425, partial [Arthrospira platensis SPKY1]|nr:hypothetical protein [Arthrospira platensis SPKY1]
CPFPRSGRVDRPGSTPAGRLLQSKSQHRRIGRRAFGGATGALEAPSAVQRGAHPHRVDALAIGRLVQQQFAIGHVTGQQRGGGPGAPPHLTAHIALELRVAFEAHATGPGR